VGTCNACAEDRCSACSGRYHVEIWRKGLKVDSREAVCNCAHGAAIDVPVNKELTVYG
jgi:hypothetical protein